MILHTKDSSRKIDCSVTQWGKRLIDIKPNDYQTQQSL